MNPPDRSPRIAAPRLPEFDVDDDRQARVAWSTLAEPGDRLAQRLVADAGPVGALREVLAGGGENRWRIRLHELDPLRDLLVMEHLQGRVLAPGDADWPDGLKTLGSEAPFCLWVRGPLNLAQATSRAAAIIGSRACTPYGEHVAADLAGGCAERDITVVSGAALGVDGCAHKGALAGGGPTIAVLANGLDRPYPAVHRQLIDRIADTNAVISEVPPGRPPSHWRFVQRNRLIAALARVVVVVETGHESGSYRMAMQAVDMGVPLAAVPGPVTSLTSIGCHRLLREHGAVCVTSADDMAELLAIT
jgi:DNA processing protein